MEKYLLIDIGGTTIKVATYSDSLNDVREYPTEANKGANNLIEKIKDIIAKENDLKAIGISTAGQVNSKEGYIIYANENMPGYTGTRWKELLENEFGIPVFVENDVNAAALGEGNYGSAKDANDFICLTYGTGIGGAIVLNGEVYHGVSGSAGEFGSLLIHSNDHISGEPYSGGYEKYASTTALVKKALEEDPTLINGRMIFSRINEEKVQKIITEWAKEISFGLVSLIHIFNPELVVLGGGIMEQEFLFNKVVELTRKEIMTSYQNVKIRKASLGNKAGLYGALTLVQKDA